MIYTEEEARNNIKEATKLFSKAQRYRNMRGPKELAKYIDLATQLYDIDGPYYPVVVTWRGYDAKLEGYCRRWEALSLLEDGYNATIDWKNSIARKKSRPFPKPRLSYRDTSKMDKLYMYRGGKTFSAKWKRIQLEATIWDDHLVATIAMLIRREGSLNILKDILRHPEKYFPEEFKVGNPFGAAVIRERLSAYLFPEHALE